MNSDEALVSESQPSAAQSDGVLVHTRAWVASGDGKLCRQVTSVERRQLLDKRDNDDTPIGHHPLDLRVELDVVHHLAGLEGKAFSTATNN